MIEQYTEVVFNKRIGPDTFLMGFRSHKMVATAKPGQFVMIRVRTGNDPLLRRPFSICSVQEADLVLILYRVLGRGTAIMAGLREREKLSVLGPLGKGFDLPEDNEVPILVAGGIGVAPLLFLAQTMKTFNIHFMTGFETANEMLPMDQITGLPLSVSIATNDGTKGHNGPVTDLLDEYLKRHEQDKKVLSVFSCGPWSMLEKISSMVIRRDLPCQVSLEAAMACGIGACQGCAVRASSNEKQAYFHVCQDGPVFPVQSIGWSFIENLD